MHFQVRRLFLRLLAVVYLAAFASLGWQVQGLIGSRGILPAAQFLDWVRGQTGDERYWLAPTLFWLDAGDGLLSFVCGAGGVLAVLLLFGLAPMAVCLLLWALYLSLTTVGQVFLGYQWDALLLEAGFLAVLFAPPGLRPRLADEPPPPRSVLWLLRLLLFRLMFSSGLVKLESGDPAWRGLTALTVHYETQPLPTWVGYFAHQLPAWFQTVSCGAMFGIELAVPFLIFGPRRMRLVAFWILAGFQVLIAATGNYAFFNLLTIALCVLLLDDEALPATGWPPVVRAADRRSRWRFIRIPFVVAIALVSGVEMGGTLGLSLPWPAPVLALSEAVAPFRVVNSYGLFAIMTTSRREIQIEGSDDNRTWRPYVFRCKPGDPRRAPAFVAPHQPRLDWQMWFAALGRCRENPWLVRFLERLLEGSPPVLDLLDENPFPGAPPRYIRAVLYDYGFSDLATRRRDGAFWQREEKGLYCPVLARAER